MSVVDRAAGGPRKGLMVILDGLGDRPQSRLGGRTPLAAARTPFLDRLARDGQCGLTVPLDPGVAVDTPTGTGLLFGVREAHIRAVSRGPVEAAGIGLMLAPGDVAVRCNFATVRKNGSGAFTLLRRRAGRIRKGTDRLAMALRDLDLGDGVRATVHAASQHRAVARLSGPNLSPRFTDTDPGRLDGAVVLEPSRPLDPGDPAARRGAKAANALLEAAFERLDGHPVNLERAARGEPVANGLITRGAGIVQPLTSILRERGLRAAVVAGERTITGLAHLLGFRVETRPEFTAMPDTDIGLKVATALELLADHDVVYLHVKAPDICAHDRNPELKREVLARVDDALSAAPVDELVMAVCGDHCTDSSVGEHCGDPVPALLHGAFLRPDACTTFDEASCARGGLGRLPASAFLDRFLDGLGAPAAEPKPGEA